MILALRPVPHAIAPVSALVARMESERSHGLHKKNRKQRATCSQFLGHDWHGFSNCGLAAADLIDEDIDCLVAATSISGHVKIRSIGNVEILNLEGCELMYPRLAGFSLHWEPSIPEKNSSPERAD